MVLSQNATEIPSTPKNPNFYIGIETGFNSFSSEKNDFDFIREEASYYYNDYNSNSYSTRSNAIYLNIKAEYRTPSDKFWVSAGLSFTEFTSQIGKFGYSTSPSDFFYIKLNSELNETHYYRINEIQETSNYVGIPVDIRYSIYKISHIIFYLKLGVDFNFKLSTERSIDFETSSMKGYEQEILDLFDYPSNFYSSGMLGGGMQLGRQDKLNIRFEANLPSVILTPTAFGLLDPTIGGGCSISLLIPIKTN